MIVPFLDLSEVHKKIRSELDLAIANVINSGQFIQAEQVAAFEDEWRTFCGANYAIGVSNGLDALKLCCLALGIGNGDEVIVPSNTFIATLLAVSAVGARPVPVSPDPLTYNLDPRKIEEKISSKTKAIIAVHLYGQPADLKMISEIASRHSLFVIEDAAQAHGARINGARIGASSDVVAWSFYPGKNLGALGDAGAVTTNNEYLANKIILLRNYGSVERYKHEIQGYNCRLDELQASVLRVKLKYLEEWNSIRSKCANYYINNLSGIACVNNDLEFDADKIVLPYLMDNVRSSWHLFVIRLRERDALMKYLRSKSIECLIHYPVPAFRQLAFRGENTLEAVEVSDILSGQILSLPIGPHMNLDMVEKVCHEILCFMGNIHAKS